MSASSHSTSTSPSSSQPSAVVDPLDLLDFTDYDGLPDGNAYNSPSLTPETSSKQQFTARPSPISSTASTMSANQTMSGPSHQYDQYKQQTPFVPGALATTLAVNQSSAHVGYDLEYMSTQMNQTEDIFDFNSAPSQASLSSPEMDMDFEPSGDASFFFNESTVNPNAIAGHDAQPATVTSNVGRMYPGMHQQAAAMAKARAQQQRQQQIIQQQQRQQQNVKQQQQQQQQQQQRPKSAQPADPLVEQKITQLLNSMRAQSSGADGQGNSPHLNVPKLKKDEEDMDEDERLLNSEEGKKLSSKERRQLRNKVSARAFRSRRKEYISQLEAEIAGKVTENGELRSQNRALLEENRRLSDLTRMLLSSNAFSGFLDHLSTNPNASAPQQPQRVEQRVEETRQVPKDVNPYSAAQQQQQQVSMVMVPEQTMDFSMLNLNSGDAFNYQPQVFTVMETPELPEFDAAILAGKASDAEFESEKSKVEVSAIEAPALLESTKPELSEVPDTQVTSTENVIADLDGDIFDDDAAPAVSEAKDDSREHSLFGGIQTEKACPRFELVDAAEEADAISARALKRVQRMSASMEATMERLERLTVGL
ncbi:hypothetical protein PG993_007216 [Apiospora rasikravindrae]|uniref:BZIP domain-containing protein n=1 Tax=Apiospora rasikravindrae TaxID=990691 RepID=A0ABR1SWV8_9PEZI